MMLSFSPQNPKTAAGFTIVEILVVITIIGILASIVTISTARGLESARIAAAVSDANNLRTAVEMYEIIANFYPPDVGRGWDPGLTKPLPYNPDTGQTTIPACPHCPTDWVNIIQASWNGPYLKEWPRLTPWKGKYDYNHWPIGASRYGCTIPPGIYVGIQGDDNNQNTIPSSAEQRMITQKQDADGCLNGEAQILLMSL